MNIRVGCAILCALILLVLATRPLSSNPFEVHQIEGDLVAWDASQGQGWLSVNGKLVPLRFAPPAAEQRPSVGCHCVARGVYQRSPGFHDMMLVADVLVVRYCRAPRG